MQCPPTMQNYSDDKGPPVSGTLTYNDFFLDRIEERLFRFQDTNVHLNNIPTDDIYRTKICVYMASIAHIDEVHPASSAFVRMPPLRVARVDDRRVGVMQDLTGVHMPQSPIIDACVGQIVEATRSIRSVGSVIFNIRMDKAYTEDP